MQGYATALLLTPKKSKYRFKKTKNKKPESTKSPGYRIVTAISNVCILPVEEPREKMQDVHD